MQIFRFDSEVSIPIDNVGSDFRIGRLTGDDTQGGFRSFISDPAGWWGDTVLDLAGSLPWCRVQAG